MLGPHWSLEDTEDPLVDGSDLILETAIAEVQPDVAENSAPAKKKFITPEIAVPVDVLEATTFFQAIASGGTN